MDAIPIFSQIKSLVQLVAGDEEGALQTQENFSRQCVIVSQVRSVVEAISGDEEAAEKTQLEFVSSLSNAVNAVPVVGHVKGTIHYIAGDKKGGDAAMKSSSRTTGVVAAGAGGFLVGGPVGAVAAGIGAGAAMDGAITVTDSIIHDDFRPYGHLEIIKDPKNPGKWCDVIGGVAMDGLTGAVSGSVTKSIKSVKKSVSRAGALAEETVPVGITAREMAGAGIAGASVIASSPGIKITVDEIIPEIIQAIKILCGCTQLITDTIRVVDDCFKSIKAAIKDPSKTAWAMADEIIAQVTDTIKIVYECAKFINVAITSSSNKTWDTAEKTIEIVIDTIKRVNDCAKSLYKSITTGVMEKETIAKVDDTIKIVLDCVESVNADITKKSRTAVKAD